MSAISTISHATQRPAAAPPQASREAGESPAQERAERSAAPGKGGKVDTEA